MFSTIRYRLKHILGFLAVLLLFSLPARAGGPPEPSIFSNPLALILLIVMVLLLIVIAILANILIGTADVKRVKRMNEKSTTVKALQILLAAMLIPGALFSQDTATPAAVTRTIGGMDSSTFYLMALVIFLELAVIIVMLLNIHFLIKAEWEKMRTVNAPAAFEVKKPRISWWDRFNKFRPVSQEAELDLGHEYDGIRELNNRLPPWWIYGFYVSIIFAVVYLWRFHVSHTGPSSIEEYETSVAKAELKTKEYLKAKGDLVDENTVKLLTASEDLAEGKAIYNKSCASCHLESGGGSVGPNLTDDFWMHGNDLKSVFKTIRYGINAMPQWQNTYSNKQIAQLTSYIKSLRGTNPANAKAPQGTEMKEGPATNPPDSTVKKEAKVAMNGDTKQK